jgi:hypothetical protein
MCVSFRRGAGGPPILAEPALPRSVRSYGGPDRPPVAIRNVRRVGPHEWEGTPYVCTGGVLSTPDGHTTFTNM